MLEIDFLMDSGATLNLLNEDTWNEIKYKNPEIQLEKANKTLTAANNTTIETYGTVQLPLTPDRIWNNRNKPPTFLHSLLCNSKQSQHPRHPFLQRIY